MGAELVPERAVARLRRVALPIFKASLGPVTRGKQGKVTSIAFVS
jgi:hypothetical protein